MATGSRILYLDFVKLFTIYLVILGHVLARMVNGYAFDDNLCYFIYSFHMPLFMLLSGYFVSSKSGELPILVILTKKAKQLLLPAITCTIICIAYLQLVRNNVDIKEELIGNSWFLKTLFVNYILFSLLKRLPFSDLLLCIISCLLLFVLPKCSSLQLNWLFPFFWGGYLMRKYKVLEKISYSWKFSLFFILLFAILYTLQRYWNIPNYIEINLYSLQSQSPQIFFRYLVALSGSLAIIVTISTLYKRWNGSTLINTAAKFGQWTLGVYMMQNIIVEYVFPDTLAWRVADEYLLDFIVAPVVSLVFLAICLWLIHLLSKNKILDLLFFGGQYYKRI